MAAPVMCVECEDTEASLSCEECQDLYCDLCFQAQHRSGSRVKHTKTPLMVVSSAVETSALTPVTVVEDVPMQVDESMETFEVDEATIAKETQLVVRRAKFIPLRLTEDERVLFNLLDASLNVSEYTDKVDILSYRSPVKRILTELSDLFNIMSGMMVASDFRNGKKKIAGQKYKDNSDFFKAVFEIGRRYKIMNPERMRNNYGKMIYLLQDASMQEIEDHFEFSCIEPTHTVHSFLESRNALDLLEDSDLPMATRSLADSCSAAQRAAKSQAIASLISRHTTANLSAADIRLVLNSIDDNNSYLALNCNPITRMQEYLEKYFQSPAPFSLEIRAGKNGARLSHSHKTQYAYAMQSLSLWKNMTLEMFKLWFAVEEDLIHGSGYRLRDTGQGLNRMQRAPQTSHLAHAILAHTQKTSPMAWVGSSAIHLGDHNVPNALMFIDKYTQVSRILSPIVQTCEFVSRMADDAYIKAMGGAEFVRQSILADFFKHGFDGSGADNFFDAGSCIDGRLTSAWNWCSKIEKKPFYHVFLMAGFVGFDGSFEKRVIDRGKPVQLHPLDASDRLSQRLDTNQDHEFLALVEVVQRHLKDDNAIDAADALAAAVNHAEQRHYSKAVLRKQHVEMIKQLQSELQALERNLGRTKRLHLLEANKCLAAVAGELVAHEPIQGKEWNKILDDAAVAYKKAGDNRFECIPAIAHKAEGDCLFGQAIATLGSSTDVDNAWTLMKEAAAAYEKYATWPHFEQCQVMLSVAAKDVAWSHKAHREVMESFESRRRRDISREVFVDTVKQRMLEAIERAKQQSTNSDITNALAQLEKCKVFMKWLHHHAPDTLEASGVTMTSITALEKKFHKASINLARSNLDAMVEYELGRTTASWIALARQDVDMAFVLVASGALRQLATVILNQKFTNLFAQLLDLGDLLLGGIASDANMLATLTLEWLKVLVEILPFESSSSGAALRRIVQLTSTKIQLHHVVAKSSFVAMALALRERSLYNVELMQELLVTVLHCGMIHAKCFDNDIRLVQLTCAIFSRYATIPEVAELAFSIVLIAFGNGVPANKAAEFQLIAALAQALPNLTKKLPVVEFAKSLAEQDKRVLGQCRQHRHAFLSVVPLSDPSWTSFIDDLTGGDTR